MISTNDLQDVTYVIGPITQAEFNIFRRYAETYRFSAKSTSLKHPDCTIPSDAALRVYKYGNKIMWNLGILTDYKVKIGYGHGGYAGNVIIKFGEFFAKFLENKPEVKEEPKSEPIVKTQVNFTTSQSTETPKEEIFVKINPARLKYAFTHCQSEAIKEFFRDLMGPTYFNETTFKVGDKFIFDGRPHVLAMTNSKVITMMDLSDFKYFSCSVPVMDINKITQSELKKLLGNNADKFELIKN